MQPEAQALLRACYADNPYSAPADDYLEGPMPWDEPAEAALIEEALPPADTRTIPCGEGGKSWLCLELAHCVATGAPFWGRRSQGGSVLYLDLESRDYRVQSRMDKTGLTGCDSLRFSFDAERLDTGLLTQLDAHLVQHEDLRLVIIDTLARVRGAGRTRSDACITDTLTLAPLQS